MKDSTEEENNLNSTSLEYTKTSENEGLGGRNDRVMKKR